MRFWTIWAAKMAFALDSGMIEPVTLTLTGAEVLTEDGLCREAIGLEGGLVDVKVCAVDSDWSGLKFMYRKKDR